MKKYANTIIAAVAASLLTVVLLVWTDLLPDTKEVRIKEIEKPSVQHINNPLASAEEGVIDFSRTAEEVMPSVVHIRSLMPVSGPSIRRYEYRGMPDPFRDFFNDDFFDRFFYPYRQPEGQPERYRQSTGSGVIINEEGYIVTNNHVIDQAEEVEVTLLDNRSFEATVIGADPTTDLALLRIDAEGLSSLPMVNSDQVKVGEWVLAVGNPMNLNSTVTAGIISAKGRNINILQDEYAVESFIQTDAAINPGNSGGALVNMQGGLIGINTAIASPTGAYAGYGFAVPANIVSKVVEDLLEYGSVQRAVLGVMIRDVNSRLAEDKDLEVTRGVYVDSVMAGGSAEASDLEVGDVILKIDEVVVNTAPQLQEQVARRRPGDEVVLLVNRFGKEKEIKVLLKSREGLLTISNKYADELLQGLGASFRTLDKEEARKLDIEGGVEVSEIYAGKLRRYTRMKEGFVITHVDKQPVSSVEELSEALARARGGVLLQGIYPEQEGVHYYGLGMEA
ncbi:MAG: Do family serine endopeptidase [Cyclobacteriaceae bacterium]